MYTPRLLSVAIDGHSVTESSRQRDRRYCLRPFRSLNSNFVGCDSCRENDADDFACFGHEEWRSAAPSVDVHIQLEGVGVDCIAERQNCGNHAFLGNRRHLSQGCFLSCQRKP